MTNRIDAYSSSQPAPAAVDPGTPLVRSQSKDAPAQTVPSDTGTTAGEAATITSGALASAQLLDHARAADGIDHAAVAQLKTAVQLQTYNVPAEQLSASIVSAMAEIKP